MPENSTNGMLVKQNGISKSPAKLDRLSILLYGSCRLSVSKLSQSEWNYKFGDFSSHLLCWYTGMAAAWHSDRKSGYSYSVHDTTDNSTVFDLEIASAKKENRKSWTIAH